MEVFVVISDDGPSGYRIDGWGCHYHRAGWQALTLDLLATGLGWWWASCGTDLREARGITILTSQTRSLLAQDLAEVDPVSRLHRIIRILGSDREALPGLQERVAYRAALEAFAAGEPGPIRFLIDREPDLESARVFAASSLPAPAKALLAKWGLRDSIRRQERVASLRRHIMPSWEHYPSGAVPGTDAPSERGV